MKSRVLVVDDDTAMSEMIGIVLRSEGFEPFFCADGESALGEFHAQQPDLVLLDLMLPGKDGIEVAREIRAESGVPIIMLTAKSDTVDVVLGLESGADDYVSKPFKPKELVARIRARLRRSDEPGPERLKVGDIEIDVTGHNVTRDGARISLTPLEFDLLVALARKPWQVFTREVLLEKVWGYRHSADTRLVNVHVQRLRADGARRGLQGRCPALTAASPPAIVPSSSGPTGASSARAPASSRGPVPSRTGGARRCSSASSPRRSRSASSPSCCWVSTCRCPSATACSSSGSTRWSGRTPR
jgi:two-component system response regulator MtrA